MPLNIYNLLDFDHSQLYDSELFNDDERNEMYDYIFKNDTYLLRETKLLIL